VEAIRIKNLHWVKLLTGKMISYPTVLMVARALYGRLVPLKFERLPSKQDIVGSSPIARSLFIIGYIRLAISNWLFVQETQIIG
jgi:hypothetical protein